VYEGSEMGSLYRIVLVFGTWSSLGFETAYDVVDLR